MNYQNLCYTAIGLFIGLGGFAQSFQTTVFDPKTDFNHCSIEQTNKGYVTVGTRFQGGNNDIHIAYFKSDGTPVWEQFIDKTKDDRGLDVTVDDKDNIVLTGYISPNGAGQPDLYIAKMDINGNFITDRLMIVNTGSPFYQRRSGGTNIIFSKKRNSYIVGGYIAKENEVPLANNGSFIAEFSKDLDLLQDRILFRHYTHQTINDIVEVKDGFFVTGGLSYTPDRQVVMAIKLDYNLSIDTDLSFDTKAKEPQCGVSLFYYEREDAIAILSNNSEYRLPQITVFSNLSSRAPSLLSNYVLDLTIDGMGKDPAGFKLQRSYYNPELLIASGYFRDAVNQEGNNGHALAWIAEFDILSGKRIEGLVWENPDALDFAYHGDGLLSTFDGAMPYIYTQEIMTERLDGEGYVLIAPRRLENHYGFDLVTTNHLEATSCFRHLDFKAFKVPFKHHASDQTIINWFINKDVVKPDYIKSEYTQFCKRGFKTQIYNTQQSKPLYKQKSQNPLIYPNPSNGLFTITLTSDSPVHTIQLYNAKGQLMFTKETNSPTIKVDLSGYQAGIYSIRTIQSDGTSTLQKVILNH